VGTSGIRVYRELFQLLRVHAAATDPEAIMRGAIAVMRSTKWAAEPSTKWAAEHQDLVIRAETSDTSLPDAMDWEVEQQQKADKAKRAAADRKARLDELLRNMPAANRDLLASMLS